MMRVSIFILLFIFGCSDSANEQNTVIIKFPIIDRCVNEILSKYEDNDAYEFKYYTFDHSLISYPEITGYMAISSKYENAKEMEPIFNAIQFTCHPTASQKFDYSPEGIEKLSENLKAWHKIGVEYGNITIENDNITMYFNHPGNEEARNVNMQSNKSLKPGTAQSAAP